MTYAELRAMILDESHREDLTARVPSFVDRAEAMIARRLRAIEMLKVYALSDVDRSDTLSAIYNLPSDFLEERNLGVEDVSLRKVSRDTLIATRESGPVAVYYMRSTASNYQVEFRANPEEASEVDLEYYARPTALSADADTNRLLDLHESVYLHAALFALYSWTQDLELARLALDTWNGAVDTLNEQAGRYLGGTGLTPGHNYGHFRIGRGY